MSGDAPVTAARGPSPAALAKAALRRLAQARAEPTPENYARAYAEEAGQPTATPAATVAPASDAKAQGAAWAALIERLARNLERGGREWTAARRKDSLQRLLDGSRSDAQRLQQRLQSLMGAWEADLPSNAAGVDVPPPPSGAAAKPAEKAVPAESASLVGTLVDTLRTGLPQATESQAAALADRLSALADAIASDGATAERLAQLESVCNEARQVFAYRHHLVESLAQLCRELGAGLVELAEDDSWVRGQCQLLQSNLGLPPQDVAPAVAEGTLTLSVRGVNAARAVLAQTREQQHQLRSERESARGALKQLIQNMLSEVGRLGEHTGRFQLATERQAERLERADSLASLTEIVRTMLDEARAVHDAVGQSQQRLQADHAQAQALQDKVLALEAELRRLSQEVSTDALTQVANRRGLMLAFETETERCLRAAPGGAAATLAVGLIDIDNFKKLNDSLGHAAGDVALKTLATAVRERLRPVDHLARFGGEEFVVLLPATDAATAQQALARLQRSLSEALFLHDGKEVFVTFSAGVSAWRAGEPLQTTLERADQALYEAKRTGKNRSCVA